jgi:L-arabinose transport system permease protein
MPTLRESELSTLLDRCGMLLVFVGLFIACSIFIDHFLSWRNMAGLGLAVSMAGMVSCSMLLCIASGNFDLSVGSVIAASGCVAAVVINMTGSVVVGIVAGLGLGLGVGLINGIVFARLGINAFITTLATMQMARGFGYIVAGGKAVGISNSDFFVIGTTYFLGLPTPVWLTVVTFVVFGWLIKYTEFGRNILAIGGNEEAARLAGVPVVRTKILIFVIHGLMCALAGVVLASRMTSGQPMTAIGFEMTAISACVLGGVSLSGGVGKISYVIAGVLILGTVENAMNLLNINPFYQYLVRGGILLAAVIFDRYKRVSAGS